MSETGPPDCPPYVAELASVRYAELTLEGVLHRVADLATRALGRPAGVSVSAVVGETGRPERVSAGSAQVDALDALQHQIGEGPAVDAAVGGQEVVMHSAGRYPQFEAAAAHAGMQFIRALPLMLDREPFGALSLYFTAVDESQPDGSVSAREFATRASAVVANALAWEQARAAIANLTRALASRGVIGQAQGVLVAREHISPDQAFDILRRASQRSNRKLRDLAAELVDRATLTDHTEVLQDADP